MAKEIDCLRRIDDSDGFARHGRALRREGGSQNGKLPVCAPRTPSNTAICRETTQSPAMRCNTLPVGSNARFTEENADFPLILGSTGGQKVAGSNPVGPTLGSRNSAQG